MKRKRRCVIVAIAGIILWIVPGCAIRQPAPLAQPPPAPSGYGTVEATSSGEWLSSRYTDVPVPRDYEYQADESFVFVQQGLRSADLRYEGDLPVEDLISFYQDSMPPNGWKFLRLTGVRMKTITFTKGGEMCEILIMSVHPPPAEVDDWRSSPGISTHLHIKVNPF